MTFAQLALPCEGCGTDVVMRSTDADATAGAWGDDSISAWCPECWTLCVANGTEATS